MTPGKDADEAQHQFAVDCRDCGFGFSTELYAERDYHANQHEQEKPGHEVVLDGRSPNTDVREDQPQLVTDGGEVEAEGTHHIEEGTQVADSWHIWGYQEGEVVDVTDDGRVGIEWPNKYGNMSIAVFVWKLRTGRIEVLGS